MMGRIRPRYLFDHLNELRKLLASREKLAVFIDLDGALASITPSPKLVRLKPETRVALESLLEDQRNRVVILSGRMIEDLKSIVKLPEVTYVGNHGLEISGPGLEFVHSQAHDRVKLIEELCGQVRSKLAALEGVIVEFKALSASVHYRLATAQHHQIPQVVESIVAQHGDLVSTTEGRRVIEIRPNVAWNRSSAVQWILQRFALEEEAAIYVGDDIGGEEAFAGLPRIISIHVGTEYGNTSARFFARSPSGVLAFMQYLPIIRRPTMQSDLPAVTLPPASVE